MQEVGFDIISDLNLTPGESFNWENKATSLYCIIAGNISSDLRTMTHTLIHLSKFYQGVFFVPGSLEYETASDVNIRTEEISGLTQGLNRVCLLYQHVVIIDGVAIIGSNGWGNIGYELTDKNMTGAAARHEDAKYLFNSIDRLQRHLDVKKIVVVTNEVPHSDLYFGEYPEELSDQIPLRVVLSADTEGKVAHWIFGTYLKGADTVVSEVNYINNPYTRGSPYWAKRLTILI